MAVKKRKPAAIRPIVPRFIYDPAIREVMLEGDVSRMKRVLRDARKMLDERNRLEECVDELERAIRTLERQR